MLVDENPAAGNPTAFNSNAGRKWPETREDDAQLGRMLQQSCDWMNAISYKQELNKEPKINIYILPKNQDKLCPGREFYCTRTAEEKREQFRGGWRPSGDVYAS